MTPTDAEMDAVIQDLRVNHMYPQDNNPHFERALMREAIARWGTPTPAGEPVGAVRYTEGWAGVKWYAKAPTAGTRLYTAPPVQPTPAGEPVGHLRMGPKEEFAATKRAEELDINVWHAVFTAPPVREPLSDEQIGALSCRDGLTNVEVPVIAWLVREVEHMHGITKGEPT